MKSKRIKYLKWSFYVVIGAISIFLITEITLNKFRHTTFTSLDKTDQEMIKLLSVEYRAFRQNSDKIWNTDFRLDKEPFMAVRTSKDFGFAGSYAFVMNIPGMESSINAKKIEIPLDFGLPDVYRITKLAFGVSDVWFPFNFGTVNFRDTKTYFFKYYPQLISEPVYGMDFSSFSIHEAFHVFKQKNWRYDLDGKSSILEYPYNKEQYALLGMEFKILDRALYNTNKVEVDSLMREWLVVRNERYTRWPQLLAETNTEAIEGTAQYTQYQYSKLIGEHCMILGTKEEPYHITFEQAYEYMSKNMGKPGFLNRGVYYETGAALGMIMDSIGINWKTMIEDSAEKQGQNQYEILKDYYHSDEMIDANVRLEDLKKRYDYDDLLQKGEAIRQIYTQE